MPLQDLQNGANSFDPTPSHDDFLDQMLSGLQSGGCWPDMSAGDGGQNKPAALPWDAVDHFHDPSVFLASKLRQHQITPGSPSAKSLLLQQQQLLGLATAGDSGLFQNDLGDASSFKSPNGENSITNLFNGLSGSLTSNQTQQFHNPPSFGSPATVGQASGGPAAGSGGAPSQPRQRVRARRGQATDPHSIAERLRRERIAERMKSLQELVPNANKTDKASMLDEIIDYVKFLQLQVKVLSMSRLGGASTVSPRAAISSEGGGDCGQASAGGGGGGVGRSSNTAASSSNNDTMTVAENQVVKLMEEDMGSAMQYLQGKGLCLMPISLATAISTATCHPSSARNNHQLLGGGGPSSPNMSALTVQSLMPRDGVYVVKDSTSVTKP